jgi:Na+/citrate or Na+/malate symporter
MKLQWSKWFYGVAGAGITGVSTSFLSALGVNSAQSVGVNVPSLDLKQLAIIAIVGGAIGTAAYLKQSPLPRDEDTPGGGV